MIVCDIFDDICFSDRLIIGLTFSNVQSYNREQESCPLFFFMSIASVLNNEKIYFPVGEFFHRSRRRCVSKLINNKAYSLSVANCSIRIIYPIFPRQTRRDSRRISGIVTCYSSHDCDCTYESLSSVASENVYREGLGEREEEKEAEVASAIASRFTSNIQNYSANKVSRNLRDLIGGNLTYGPQLFTGDSSVHHFSG